VYLCVLFGSENKERLFPYTDWFLLQRFNPLKPSGHYIYHQFNTQQFYVLPTQCIYMFCVDLRTNSDYFPIQHYLTGFYNRDLTLYSPVITICTAIYHSTILRSAHTVCLCFVWIWEQTDYFPIQLYLIGFYNRDLTLYSPVVTIQGVPRVKITTSGECSLC